MSGEAAGRKRWSVLQHVLGPDGHGPSSSHTIAPQRAAHELFLLLGGRPERAEVVLYNSFATTGAGHRTDVAILAGLLGLDPIDPRTPKASVLAEEAGLTVVFSPVQDPHEHPNTLVFRLSRHERSWTGKVLSVGGGNIEWVDGPRCCS